MTHPENRTKTTHFWNWTKTTRPNCVQTTHLRNWTETTRPNRNKIKKTQILIKCQSFFYLYVKLQVDQLGNKEVTIYPTPFFLTNKVVRHYAILILCLLGTSEAVNQYEVHILSSVAVTDICLSWISRRRNESTKPAFESDGLLTALRGLARKSVIG